MEEYHYIPIDETHSKREIVIYDPNYPPFYDVVAEANDIVNEGFGDDYDRDIMSLVEEKRHAEGCGCSVCLDNYNIHIFDVAYKYMPRED